MIAGAPRSRLALAATAALFAVACVNRASTISEPSTEFEVALTPATILVFAECTGDEIAVRAVSERECVRWEYRERHVGVPHATEGTAFAAQVLTGSTVEDDDGDFEDAWPEPHEPLAPPQRRRDDTHTATRRVCEDPASGIEFQSGTSAYVTDDRGGFAMPRTDGPVVVRHDGVSWTIDCTGGPTQAD